MAVCSYFKKIDGECGCTNRLLCVGFFKRVNCGGEISKCEISEKVLAYKIKGARKRIKNMEYRIMLCEEEINTYEYFKSKGVKYGRRQD